MPHGVLRALAAVGIAWLAVAAISAADPETTEPDPWSGKARADVVRQLGEPDKAKTARDGRETLIYTFHPVPAGASLDPEVMVLHVPGVGVVARVARGGPPGAVDLGPPEVDREGRVVGGGGPTRTSSASASYDPKTKEVTRTSSEQGNPQLSGKVKLQLVLGADGRVESWTVVKKKK